MKIVHTLEYNSAKRLGSYYMFFFNYTEYLSFLRNNLPILSYRNKLSVKIMSILLITTTTTTKTIVINWENKMIKIINSKQKLKKVCNV